MIEGILIGIGLVLAYGFVVMLLSILGIPLETRKGREKRAVIAAQMQEQALRQEAERQLRVEQIKRESGQSQG